MKIVFFGTTDFASAGLKALKEAGHEIVGVVTTPDRPQGRHYKLVPCDVKKTAIDLGISPILEPEKLKNPEFVEQLRSLCADLFVVIAFRMLPEVVWSMPPKGTINIHGSLLPAYRGAAPINRAIMAGEKETGVSAFILTHEIDTGDVIGRKATEIGPDETFGELYRRLMGLGAELLCETVDKIEKGEATAVKQDELSAESKPSEAPKIFNDDCVIDWSRPAFEIHNQIRGLAPAPAAFSTLINEGADSLKVKILKAKVAEESETDKSDSTDQSEKCGHTPLPGTIILSGKKLLVACGEGAIEILQLQPAGKKAMDTRSWLNGARLSEARFE